MALPGDLTTFTLTFGPYTDAKGDPVLANVTGTLRPSTKLLHPATGRQILESPIKVSIDAFGVASVGPLPHTDNAALAPTGFTYQMVWDLGSSAPSPGNKQFAVPAASGIDIDFDLLTPTTTTTGVDVVLPSVISVAGLSGAPTAQQLTDALDGPLRAALGTVLNVKWYGATGDGSTDDTTAFADAIAACRTAGGGVVYAPPGTYIIDKVTLAYGVTIRGAGPNATMLKAKAGGTSRGLVEVAAGPVQFAHLEHLELVGVGTVGQGGVYASSVGAGGTPNHGGWWSGGIRNVFIGGFAGPGIWLRANGSDGLLPHQYLVLEQVDVRATGTYEALLISGAVGQIAVINGFYVGPDASNGSVPSVRISREIADNRTTVVSDTSPYAVSFHQASFQSNGIGLLVDRSVSVSAMGPHFEDCNIGAKVDTGGALTIVGANMQRGVALSGSSIGFQAVNTGIVRAVGTSFFGAVDKHFDGNVQAVDTFYGGVTSGPTTTGVTKQTVAQLDNTLPLGDVTTALVNGDTKAIKTLVSSKGPGESVYLKAFGGSIVLDYGGTGPGAIADTNLTLPLTVPQNAVVHLVKMDLAGYWNIVSVTKP